MSSAEAKIVSNAQVLGSRQLLNDVSEVFQASNELLYQARNVIRKATWRDSDYVIKSFRRPKRLNRLIYRYLRKSKARRSYENSLRLLELGFCAPTPVGFRENVGRFSLLDSFYVSLFLPYQYTLEPVLHGVIDEERTMILSEFGGFVYSLHVDGILHKDLSPGNVLITKQEKGIRFCLVDVNRMKFGFLSDNQRFKNFSMLWASDADLKIVVDAYAKIAGIDPGRAYSRSLYYSRRHKRRAERKEKIKRWLKLS
jgi:tRNA A-37 threonylcarbamoyl transferase component Bud32